MAELSHKDRTIGTKIVYYGPAMSGKTTNIQVLHERATGARRGELVSVNTAQDRTIMFDLLPIKVAAFRGLDLKVQLMAVPGQPMYAAIRKLALRDVDALVFVADSAVDRQEENLASLKELMANLAGRAGDATSLPLVLQYNKRDLADAVPIHVMDRTLNTRQGISRPAMAIRGDGVLETFTAILTATVADLARRYRLADLGRGQTVEEWAQAAVQEIYGVSSFPPSTQAPAGGSGTRTVRLTLPPDVASASRLDARTNEALVESYAQASATLTDAMQQVREERDLAQRRLADVLQVLDAVRTLKSGAARDPLYSVVLSSLAQEVETAHATLLVPVANLSMRASAYYGLEQDPILCHAEAMPRLRGMLQGSAPRWHETDNDPDLREMLAAGRPPHGSVISVPLLGQQETPLGVALLYRGPSAPPPRRESLKHLAALARILAPFLESANASGADGDTTGREILATAFRLASPRLVQCLRDVRQKLADLRRHPDAPAWLLNGLADIGPLLGESAAISRSLSGLEGGTLEDETMDVGSLLARLRDVHVETGPGVGAARVDPILFPLALEAVVDRARRQAGDRPVEVRCTQRTGRLTWRIGVPGPVSAGRSADQALAFPLRVIEMHGGQLNVEVDASAGSWVVFDVPAS